MFKPDFLLIPYAIKSNPELRPSDGDVYAIIYWFEKMKEGRCIASNETIAEVACCGTRNVRGALDRLEKEGYIERIYSDKARTKRAEIKTKVHFGNPMAPGPLTPATPEPQEETPGEFAKRFFGRDEGAVEPIIQTIIEKTNAPEDLVRQEIDAFIVYWTEPNSTGSKLLWQKQPTFEVTRRIATWLRNKKQFSAKTAKAGAGRVV